MIALMLYIQRNLRLKTLQMLQNQEFYEDGILYTLLYDKSDDIFHI